MRSTQSSPSCQLKHAKFWKIFTLRWEKMQHATQATLFQSQADNSIVWSDFRKLELSLSSGQSWLERIHLTWSNLFRRVCLKHASWRWALERDQLQWRTISNRLKEAATVLGKASNKSTWITWGCFPSPNRPSSLLRGSEWRETRRATRTSPCKSWFA